MSKLLANQIANYGDNAPVEIKECLNFAIKASGASTTKKGAADAMPYLKDLSKIKH